MGPSRGRLLIMMVVTLSLGGILFPVAVRLWGYNPYTYAVFLVAPPLLGLYGVGAERVGARDLGLTLGALWQALLVFAVTHGSFIIVRVLAGALGWQLEGLTFSQLTPIAWFDNWLLTGVGEELLFRGYFFLVLWMIFRPRGFPWVPVLGSSLLFSLYHVPYSLWMGQTGLPLVMDAVIPLVSALVVFTPAYILTRNLWFVGFLHGATDLPLLPAITNNPVFGLAFMALALFVGWLFHRGAVRSQGSWPPQ